MIWETSDQYEYHEDFSGHGRAWILMIDKNNSGLESWLDYTESDHADKPVDPPYNQFKDATEVFETTQFHCVSSGINDLD